MTSSTKKTKEELQRSLRDPVLFAKRILRHNVWSKQEEILRSLSIHRRTAVKACHASGKTFTAAEATLWWITHLKNGIVITTAPTMVQVERLLWGEIHNAVSTAKIAYPKPTLTTLRLGPNRYAIGLSTNECERFQGFHGDILIILDEAPGVRPQIYEAIEGIRAGGDVRVLALGNPTISSGPFFDAFNANREGWNLITISAFDTPNLQGLTLDGLLKLPEKELDNNPFPFLTTRRWVKEKHREWGPGHPLWESRVLGQFPMQGDDALISLEWLEKAKYREGGEDGCFHAGLDVGGPGESETVLCVRNGHRIVHWAAWTAQDPRGKVIADLLPFKDRLQTVNVDRVGVGEYMGKHLRDHGFPVREINVGERSDEPEKFANQKGQFYWGLRMRFEIGTISGLTDERTIAQLAGIRFSHTSAGQVLIESKDDARKRGVKSPDRAEAVMLAFAEVQLSEYRIRIPRLW